MDLVSRAPTSEDFTAFYDNLFRYQRADVQLRGQVRHEWHVFLAHPRTLSLLVEDRDRASGDRVVGCAQAVFVSDQFVQDALSGGQPWLNRQAADVLPDGSSPLLTPAEVDRANPNSGLTTLVTRWGRALALEGSEEEVRVQRYASDEFLKLTRGHQFREILLEVIGTDARRRAVEAGFSVRNDYADFTRQMRCPWRDSERPYLMGVTREEAAARESTLISQFFLYTVPRLGLPSNHRELLRAALRGLTDEQIAGTLYVSAATVKKWWSDIYRYVEERDPGILPSKAAGSDRRKNGQVGRRGPEKRGRLLHYLRDHLEELAPG